MRVAFGLLRTCIIDHEVAGALWFSAPSVFVLFVVALVAFVPFVPFVLFVVMAFVTFVLFVVLTFVVSCSRRPLWFSCLL